MHGMHTEPTANVAPEFLVAVMILGVALAEEKDTLVPAQRAQSTRIDHVHDGRDIPASALRKLRRGNFPSITLLACGRARDIHTEGHERGAVLALPCPDVGDVVLLRECDGGGGGEGGDVGAPWPWRAVSAGPGGVQMRWLPSRPSGGHDEAIIAGKVPGHASRLLLLSPRTTRFVGRESLSAAARRTE